MAVAAIAALSSCSSDNEVFNSEVKKALTFTATMEGIGGTRAEFDSEAKCAKWEEGDEIIIVGVDEEENDPTTAPYVASGTSGDVTTFEPKNSGEEVSGVFFEAFFPASIIGKEGTESPAVINEEWKKDQFNMPMAATSRSTNLKFKNLCGVLAITVKDDQLSQVKSIKVSSANRSVSGILFPYFDVDKEDGAMTNLKVALTTSDDPSKTLTVNYTNPVETDASGKVFYVAIPPSLKIHDDEENEIFEYLPDPYKELKIEISDGNGTTKSMTTKKDVNIVIERNKIYNITFKDNTPTTGKAKATIGGSEVDVNWVQLWAGGPKFAEYNIGASSVTDLGTIMTFTEATKAGADYVWGDNWCTPSKKDMEHLMTAAKGVTDDKVKCEYTQEGSQYGFKFTGLTNGYTDNSVFFPVQDGDSNPGHAVYWSATAEGSGAWYMSLFCINGNWLNDWHSGGQGSEYLVRPVLKN